MGPTVYQAFTLPACTRPMFCVGPLEKASDDPALGTSRANIDTVHCSPDQLHAMKARLRASVGDGNVTRLCFDALTNWCSLQCTCDM